MNASRILAATDFSVAADQALSRAAMIVAANRSWQLEVINVANIRSLNALKRLASGQSEPIQQLLVDEATVRVRRVADEFAGRFSISVESFVAIGNPAEQIVEYAKQREARLIVAGARGANPARDLLLGTTAQKIIRQSRGHSLIVKQPAKNPYRKILAATDFSESSLAALRAARSVAPDAELEAVHAFEVPFEGMLKYAGVAEKTIAHYRHEAQIQAESAARACMQEAGLGDICAVSYGYPARVIREYSERAGVELIAVGKHGQSTIEELLIGSVSEHVLANAECDVLVASRAARS